MRTLFLSYSSQDREHASLLAQGLASHGITVWQDQQQLHAGDRWPKKLGEAIAASDALLLLWSRPSSQSDFVELEWITALALKKQIVPCLLDDPPPPSSLAAVHSIAAAPLADAVGKIINVLAPQGPTGSPPPNSEKIISQLAEVRATNPSDVLKELRQIQGSFYQAGRDIYIGTTPAPQPKTLLDKWQAWVAIVVGLLTAVSLIPAIRHTLDSPSAPASASATTPSNQPRQQPFAGSIWTAANNPLPGVKISLLSNGTALATTQTDDLGHFNFQVTAPAEADITLIAQKEGFQTEKRYTNLGNTNFNFTMTGAPR